MKVKPAAGKEKVVVELGSKDESLLRPLPFQLRRILVPIDFSNTSKKALQYALPFATAFDAEVVLLHVMQPFAVPAELGYMPPDLPETQQVLLNSAREELDRVCASELGERVRARVEVREGVPWQEVAAVARETGADLIILGTHGRTGLQHVLLGSVAERVIRHSSCPVLVVREHERDFILPSGPGAAESA